MEDVVSRSYRDEGRIFLPSASTIDSIREKSTRKTLRTRPKRCDTLYHLRSGLTQNPRQFSQVIE